MLMSKSCKTKWNQGCSAQPTCCRYCCFPLLNEDQISEGINAIFESSERA